MENDEKGRILQINAPAPDSTQSNQTEKNFAIARYEYDAEGNMVRQINAVGDAMEFRYENRLMVQETWRNGLKWFFKYDGNTTGARCVHTWGDGNIQNHKLTFYDGLTKVENRLGHVTEYYHTGGLVTKQIDPNGAEHLWRYDKDNQMLSETDPMGNTHLYSYDDWGNQTTVIDPIGTPVATEYENPDLPHLPTEALDANGGKWKWKYDEQGNVLERQNPMGAKSKIEYGDGLLKSITDALGNATTLHYNTRYEVETVTDTHGNETHYRFDALGRCVQITNPKGAVQTRKLDLMGRVVEVKDFDGNQIELKYDGIDNLLHYKDSQQEVRYRYKGMWKMTFRQDKRGSTLFKYDTEERLTEIVNENKDSYRFRLDEVGNVVSETQFDEQTKHYERDLAGRVVTLTKPNGKKLSYEYDANGRVVEIYHDYEETPMQSFAYNQAGQLIRATNADSEVKFTRNVLGLITEENTDGKIITNEYNAIGQRTSLQSSMGADINYEHDGFGRLAKLTANEWKSEHEYDQFGFELSRLLPNKLSQSFEYDRLGRLTQQQTLQDRKQKRQRKYTWGKNDRLKEINDSQNGKTSFGYTETGHLEFTEFADKTKQYRKTDKVGNLYESEYLKDRVYSDGGRLEKKGSWNYKYDSEGFLIQKYKGSGGIFGSKSNVWKYKWNAEGMLQTVTRPDKLEVHFTYDALGRRISKQFRNTTTKWLWDGNVPLHEWKENANGEILSKTSVDKDGIITWVFEENSFVPTAKLKGEKKESILTDHLGTPISMYNENGEKVWERELDSFGRVVKGNSNQCPFLYQGQYYDKEIELAYNRFRYYDPQDGRYVSVDPIGLASGEYNLYSYVHDSNIFTDVFGLSYKSQKRDKKGKFQKKDADESMPGKDFEKIIEDKLRANKNVEVLGTNVTVSTSLGKRFIDILFRNKKTNKIFAGEVKSNSATRNKSQKAKDKLIDAGEGVVGNGVSEKSRLKGRSTKGFKSIVIKIFG